VWQESYTYEAATARPSVITTTINETGAVVLTTATAYDASGRADTRTYPSGLVVKTTYTASGQVQALSNNASTTYWTATAENEWDHVTGETFLGGTSGAHQDYHSTGQAYQLSWGGAITSDRLTYGYDTLGNLISQQRTAVGANNQETYAYDPLQRLTQASRTTGGTVNYGYSRSGNLAYKSDFSLNSGTGPPAYTYAAANSRSNGCGPHAATTVQQANGLSATYTCDANGNVTGGNTLTVSFDADNRPTQVTRTYVSGSSDTIFCDGLETATTCGQPGSASGSSTWTYDGNGQRAVEVSAQGTRYYGPGGYERINGVHAHELGPVIVTRTGASDAITVVLKDRLGSTLATLDGSNVTRRAFDAFGKARNGDLSDRANGSLNLADTIHGFTTHTHADAVALIHMNGRVFDPNLGRFLSVDPIIGNPLSTQSLNPYSYIGNNPLSGTDPTGYDCQEDKNGAVESSCLASNNGVNKITSVNGKPLGTVIVADKGDNISGNLSNGGSFSATFTGKTGDISRVLNGTAPTDIGSISKTTNGTLDGTAASYAFGQDKPAAQVTDVLAQQQRAQQQTDALAYQQYTFAREALEGVPILGVEALGQAAYGAYNEVRQSGGISAATAISAAVIATTGVLHIPGAVGSEVRTLAEDALDDSALVCRGGTCIADRFANGRGVSIDIAGNLNNVSVNSASGASLKQLTATIPNKQVGATTVGDIRRAGGSITPSATTNNRYHCTICGLTPQKAEELFTPTVPNPNGG